MDENYSGLIVRKDKLVYRQWGKPEFKDDDSHGIIMDGYYSETDVSEKLPAFLNTNVIVADGVTLRDFFRLLEPHKDILKILFYRDFFQDYLEFGLNSPVQERQTQLSDADLPFEYLEVFASLQHEVESVATEDRIMEEPVYIENENGEFVPDESTRNRKIWSKGDMRHEKVFLTYVFGGKTVPVTQEYLERYGENCCAKKVGERIPYGLLGSELGNFIDVPLKINPDLVFTVEDYYCSDVSKRYVTKTLRNFVSVTLFDVIGAIFCEISFYGNPEATKEWEEDIQKQIREIDSKTTDGDI